MEVIIRADPELPPNSLSKILSADEATEEAVRRALGNNDIQSIFFVNQIAQNQSERTISNLNASNYYSFPRVERTVFDKVEAKELPDDTSLSSGIARSSYRARVFDYSLTTTPWLAMEAQVTGLPKDLPITSYHNDKTLYQEAIYKTLTNFTYPIDISTRLEMTAKTIAEIYTLTRDQDPYTSTRRFLVLITFIRTTGATPRPVLRAYQLIFEKKNDSERPLVSFFHTFYATIFNEQDFETALPSIDPRLIKLGKRLTEQISSDIYLPSLGSAGLER